MIEIGVYVFPIGCGFRELGLKVPSNRRIPDKDITASSQRIKGRAAYRGRIGVEVMGTWQDGWCSSQTDPAPYLQVFFGEYIFTLTFVLPCIVVMSTLRAIIETIL